MSDDIDVVDPRKLFGTLTVGEWATDDNEDVLVLELEDTPANECVLFETPGDSRDITVASHHTNHEYADDALIAHVIHPTNIEKAFDGEMVSATRVLEAYNRGEINDRYVYQYPRPRLKQS